MEFQISNIYYFYPVALSKNSFPDCYQVDMSLRLWKEPGRCFVDLFSRISVQGALFLNFVSASPETFSVP